MKWTDNFRSSLEKLNPRPLKYLAVHLQSLIEGKLWLKIVIAMVAGIGIGFLLGPTVGWLEPDTSRVVGKWLALPGYVFLAMIQMIVIPLVFSSVIRGLAGSEDMEKLKSLGLKAAGYFVLTTAVAIIIGITLTTLIRPGDYVTSDMMKGAEMEKSVGEEEESAKLPGIEEIPTTIVNIMPDNPFTSVVEKQMLQIVVFAVFIGIALLAMPPKQARPLLDLFGSIQSVCMLIVKWAMMIAPFAVFGLLANLTATVGLDVLAGMAVYVLTVLGGLAILVVFYLLLVTFVGKKSPLKFLSAAREVQLLAFSTSSSAAVMPLSINTADNKLGVRPSISQFIVPLGATINMDGTALYQGAAAIFLAQVYGIDLSLASKALIIVTSVSASIGAPATPGVGIVILATILTSVGIPASGIAMIIGVDRILDMSRTAVNVTGDLTACTVMDRLVGGKRSAKEQLEREEELERKRDQNGTDTLENGDEES
ncbi:MAG: dicarboxylate/amino acid:cation symporter [Planctomycetota bacterium]|nr:dicarboxylate/amino acid:cation symporter [Planctomycetota bacterium]